jgi:hypothetical protein
LSKRLSTSKLNTYMNCPFKYYLQYVAEFKAKKTSKELEFGKYIHNLIATSNFNPLDSNNLTQILLRRAQNFVNQLPSPYRLETSYSDPANPCRFLGEIEGKQFVGVFDIVWEPVVARQGLDWKTGKFNNRYLEHLDIQAYILNELYKERYDVSMDEFYFKFLKTGDLYCPRCVHAPGAADETRSLIVDLIEGIEDRNFYKVKRLCKWCEYKAICDEED